MGDEEQGRLYLAQGLRCTNLNAYSNDDGEITSNRINAELNSTFERLIKEVAAPVQSEVKSAVRCALRRRQPRRLPSGRYKDDR